MTNPRSDDRDMLPVNLRNRARNTGQTGGLLSAFGPGGAGLLASQLNQGFGGGQGRWENYMNQVYSPMQMPAPFEYGQEPATARQDHPGWRENHQPDQRTPDQPTNQYDGWSPRGNLATLGGQQQMQLTPEMLAMIRQRLGQRG